VSKNQIQYVGAKLSLLAGLLMAGLAQAQAQSVDVLTYHTHPPFMQQDQGLSYDLVDMLNEQAGGRYTFTLKAKSRPALNKDIAKSLDSGAVLLIPWVNPNWFQDADKTKYLWLDQALMQDGNSVVSSATKPLFYTGPESLDGLVLGGLKGHSYKGIDERIKTHKLTRRVNANNHLDNFNKLIQGRIDATITPRSSALYLMVKEGLKEELFISPTSHTNYARMAFVTGGDVALQAFLNDLFAQPEINALWQSLGQKYQ